MKYREPGDPPESKISLMFMLDFRQCGVNLKVAAAVLQKNK